MRKAGETSIEALLETLIALKLKQEQLNEQLSHATAIVQQKEALIRLKEEDKSSLQTEI